MVDVSTEALPTVKNALAPFQSDITGISMRATNNADDITEAVSYTHLVAFTTEGKGGVYRHGEVTKNVATIEALWLDPDTVPEAELSETTYAYRF